MESLIRPYVKNEWGQLREIIVGSAYGAQVPTIGDKCLHCVDYAHLSDDEFLVLCKELNKNKGLLLIGAIRELPPKLAAFAEWRKGLTYMPVYA